MNARIGFVGILALGALGAYNVQATVNRTTCAPIKVRIVKATVQVVDLTCPPMEA